MKLDTDDDFTIITDLEIEQNNLSLEEIAIVKPVLNSLMIEVLKNIMER